MSPEAEVLLHIIDRQLGDFASVPVRSVPETGRLAYGLKSAAASYDWARKGAMPGVIKVSDDRMVVSTAVTVSHLLGQLKGGDDKAHNGGTPSDLART